MPRKARKKAPGAPKEKTRRQSARDPSPPSSKDSPKRNAQSQQKQKPDTTQRKRKRRKKRGLQGFFESFNPEAAENQDREAEGEAEEDEKVWTILRGNTEAMSLWTDSLNLEEKREVLDVTIEEVTDILRRIGLSENYSTQEIEDLLDNKEYMTKTRMEFVEALYEEGEMLRDEPQLPQDALYLALITTMENHLHFLYTDSTIIFKIFTFVGFILWNWDTYRLIRYPLLAVLLWLCWSENPRVISLKSILLLPFQDTHYDRMETRADAILCGILCAYWATWFSRFGYVVVIVMACLPLLTCEAGRRSNVEEKIEKGIQDLSTVFLTLSCLQLLYLAWFSWTSFAYVAFIFFPKTTVLVFGAICTAVAVLSALIDMGIGRLIDLEGRWKLAIFLTLAAFAKAAFFSKGWFRCLYWLATMAFFPKVMPLSGFAIAIGGIVAFKGVRVTLSILMSVVIVTAMLLAEFIKLKWEGESSENEGANEGRGQESKFSWPWSWGKNDDVNAEHPRSSDDALFEELD